MSLKNKYDVCIVGAGVAGASLAAYLGKAGLSVIIIERNLSERDVIVGELLQPGGVALLQDLGLEAFLHNIDAQPVKGYNVIFQGKHSLIEYPSGENHPTGFGFRNGKFLQNMRAFIQSLPGVDVVEGRVSSLIEDNESISGLNYSLKNSDVIHSINAALTVVSDGPLSRFRSELSKPDVKVNGYFLGIILEGCGLPEPRFGHLVMGPHPPFVMYPVNSNEIRILIDFPGEKPPKINDELKDELIAKFLDAIPAQMQKSFVDSVQQGGFKMMPNHRLPASPIFKSGAVLIGDSLNMRHPLTGGGMTAAFSDVRNLGTKLAEVDDFGAKDKIDSVVKSFYESRHHGNQTINILADGLYKVVIHPDLQEAFFEYVCRGGNYASEPIAILAGLNKDKKLLQKHFLAVANYGTKLKIRNESGTRKIGASYSLMKEAVKIITPLLLTEKPDQATRILLKTLAYSGPAGIGKL